MISNNNVVYNVNDSNNDLVCSKNDCNNQWLKWAGAHQSSAPAPQDPAPVLL